MRLSVILVALSLAGVLGGAWLIGLPAFGAAIIFDSLCIGVLGVLTLDLPDRVQSPSVTSVPSLHDVLERARQAP